MPAEVSLEIPVDPAFAVTARLFVSAAARDLGASEGSVEDLRLAASELVANAVETNHPGPISLTIWAVDGELLLRATGVGPIGDEPPIGRRSLLLALFDADELIIDGSVQITVAVGD